MEAERLAAIEKTKVEKELFSRSVGPVKSLQPPPKVRLVVELPAPIPLQRQRDEQAVLREALSDEWDATSLLDTDEALSFRRPGVGLEVVRKLRKGDWSVQAHLDLHNARTDEARQLLGHFIREAHKQGLRCVRVVHGKGLGSPGKVSVLKPKVQSWLIQKNQVIAFVQALPAQGGAGALVVLLQGGSARLGLARSLEGGHG
ncbi:MAG: DNA mismatch repair protein MutS [Brachymonas sp.]|nr:DNA mismatch repair protein MutS [Brachymonas sp.]